jgi:hypothetical protein
VAVAAGVEVREGHLPRDLERAAAVAAAEGYGDVPLLVAELEPELHGGQLVDVRLEERVPLGRGELGLASPGGRAVDGARVLRVDGDEGVPREQGADGVQLRFVVRRRDRSDLDTEHGCRHGVVVLVVRGGRRRWQRLNYTRRWQRRCERERGWSGAGVPGEHRSRALAACCWIKIDGRLAACDAAKDGRMNRWRRHAATCPALLTL